MAGISGDRKSLHVFTVQEAQNASLGQGGAIFIDDQVEHTGVFVAVTAITDAAVDVSECDVSFIEDIADFTIPKGVTIFGRFKSIELDSGSVIAYYG